MRLFGCTLGRIALFVLTPALGLVESANGKLATDGIAPIESSLGFHGLQDVCESPLRLRRRCRLRLEPAWPRGPALHTEGHAQATKRRERLSGPHLHAYDRALDWHEWALSPKTSFWWFPRRQQKNPA